jgi:lipoprotein-releasing system ATP-binding protein
MSEAALELRGLHRRFKQAAGELHVLRGLDFRLMPGECVALVGPSGAGKSTLLHCAGLLEKPDAGAVLLGGRDCASMDEARGRRRGWRNWASSINSTISCPSSRRSRT